VGKGTIVKWFAKREFVVKLAERKKGLGLWTFVQIAAIVPAVRCKPSFRFASSGAFRFHPAAVEQLTFMQLFFLQIL
jgi:hypothetical protein